MAQDIVLALDDYERRYLTTVDPIETVLGDAYLNKFKRELEIDEILTVRIGSERHRIRIIQTDPFVATVREYDSYFDNRISALETGTPPPDPDPTDPATWNATLDPNKLVADNVVFNYTQLANRGWIIVVDSATVPTNDAVLGVSPPTGFTPGDWPRTNPASSYSASEDWYFYEYDDVAGIVLVSSTVGDDFVTVTPRDTLAPTGLALAIDGSGNWTITEPVDAGIGLAVTGTYDIYIDDTIYISGTTSPTGNLGLPGGTYSAYAVARDAAGNATTTAENQIEFTIASSGAGIVSLPTTEQTVAEGAGSITIPITRDNLGGTATDDFSVDVYTTDWTAESGTNFTGITPGSPTTVSFAGGSTSENLVISITNVPELTNKQFFVVLDWDSADFASGAVQRGTESVSVIITGGGLTALAGYQMTETDPFYVAVQCENYANGGSIRNSITTGQTADAWVTDDGARYADGARMSTPAANTYGSATVLDPESYYLEYQIAFNSTAVAANATPGKTGLWDILLRISCHNAANSPPNSSVYVGPVHLTLINPITDITVGGTTATVTLEHDVVLSMATHTVWFEGVTGTNAAEYNSPSGTPSNGLTVATHVAGTKVFTITGMTAGSPGAQTTANLLGADQEALNLTPTTAVSDWSWLWQQDDEASNSIQVGCNTAATRYLRIYGYLTSADIDCFTVSARVNNSDVGWTRTDVNITDNGVRGNALDDDMGHVQSTYSASSSENPSADAENTDILQLPLPDATVNPTTITPASGLTGQSQTIQVFIEFSGMTLLYLNKFNLLLPSGAILGSPGNPGFTVTQTANSATLTPDSPLTDGITYTVEVEGRVLDGTVMKSIALLNPPHQFTVIDVTAPETLYSENFNSTGFSLPHTLTEAECISNFGWQYAIPANAGIHHLVADPAGGGRGAVFKIDFKKDAWANFEVAPNGINAKINLASEEEEVYVAYDIFIPNDFIFNFGCKNFGLKTKGAGLGAGASPPGEYALFTTNWWGNNSWLSSFKQPFTNIDGDIAAYQYYVNTPQREILTGTPYTKGVWNRIEFHGKMNNPRTSSNGEYNIWKNGQNILSSNTRQWLTTAAKAWDHVWVIFYAGGDSDIWRMPQDQSIYIDNIIISTNPITH